MTKGEIAWGSAALLAGLAVGALLVRRCQMPHASRTLASQDASAPPSDAWTSSDAIDGGEPTPPTLDAREAVPDATSAEVDASISPPADAGRRLTPRAHPALLEKNLLIHPVGAETLCVDASLRSSLLQLYPCHGKKNQRWTFSEDPNGTSRISGAEGCLRVGAAIRGEPTLEMGSCGADTERFRHTEDRRIEDTHSKMCVTVHQTEAHARLVLAPCNSSRGQSWSLTP